MILSRIQRTGKRKVGLPVNLAGAAGGDGPDAQPNLRGPSRPGGVGESVDIQHEAAPAGFQMDNLAAVRAAYPE